MNKEKWIRFSFILPLIFLMGWIAYLTIFTAAAQQVTVRITGYDPRDLLSGHYLAYQIDWSKTDCAQFKGGICPRQAFAKISHRFYLPQREAKKIDTIFQLSSWNNNSHQERTFEIVFSYIPGRTPVAQQLLIDGKDWRSAITN